MNYSVIIPIHNSHKRGIDRLKWQLLSLKNQTTPPAMVFIPDSSDLSEFLQNVASIKSWQSPPVHHFGCQHKDGGFNMPHLFNRGLERVETNYVLCTGIDFIYDPNLFTRYMDIANEKTLILKEVEMLANMAITADMVNSFKFRKSPLNGAGRGADGIQFGHINLFKDLGGYDERMAGWGGMDNDLHDRSNKAGYKEVWCRGGRILHQWHRTEKGKGADLEQSKRNWRLRDLKNKEIRLKFIK